MSGWVEGCGEVVGLEEEGGIKLGMKMKQGWGG
jgi:hypothetical protein